MLEACEFGDNDLAGYPPLQHLYPKDTSFIDPVCCSIHNSFHKKLQRKLEARHTCKKKITDEPRSAARPADEASVSACHPSRIFW